MNSFKLWRKVGESALGMTLFVFVLCLGGNRSPAEGCKTIVKTIHCPGANGTLPCSTFKPTAGDLCNHTTKEIRTGAFGCTDQSTAFGDCEAVNGGTDICTETFNCRVDLTGVNCETELNPTLTLTTTAGTYEIVPCHDDGDQN